MKKIMMMFLTIILATTFQACQIDITPVGKRYTVTFDSMGGSEVSLQVINDDGFITVPKEPTKDGFVFEYWSESNLTIPEPFVFVQAITKNINLIAIWLFDGDIQTFTIAFDNDGGTSFIPSQLISSGELVEEPLIPSKKGYTFKFWALINDVTTSYSFDTPVEKDLNLIAIWQQIGMEETFTVTFNNLGGSTTPTQEIKSGKVVVKPMNPIKEGLVFKFWALSTKLTVEYRFDSLVFQDITLVAIYESNLPQYSIGFYDGLNFISAISASLNTTITKVQTPHVKVGFTLEAWYINKELTIKFLYTTPISNDLSLYGNWRTEEFTDYYSDLGIENSSGEQLRSILKRRLNEGIKITSYGGTLNTPLKEADQHPKDSTKVWTIYDGAMFGKNQNGSGGTNAWNKEHVVPKSYYNTKYKKNEGDVHNLRVCIAQTNSNRLNWPFGDGAGKPILTKNQFYPGDEHRGDSARIALYMMVMLPDMINFGTRGKEFGEIGTKEMLLRWHEEDPVDAFEIRRNQVLFEFQNNRNPFIDHPSLVSKAFEGETKVIAPQTIINQHLTIMNGLILDNRSGIFQ